MAPEAHRDCPHCRAEINEGKFILLLRRAPRGQWLIAADMDNPNTPPRQRQPPSNPE